MEVFDFQLLINAFLFGLFIAIGCMIFERLDKKDMALWFGLLGFVIFAGVVVYKIWTVAVDGVFKGIPHLY